MDENPKRRRTPEREGNKWRGSGSRGWERGRKRGSRRPEGGYSRPTDRPQQDSPDTEPRPVRRDAMSWNVATTRHHVVRSEDGQRRTPRSNRGSGRFHSDQRRHQSESPYGVESRTANSKLSSWQGRWSKSGTICGNLVIVNSNFREAEGPATHPVGDVSEGRPRFPVDALESHDDEAYRPSQRHFAGGTYEHQKQGSGLKRLAESDRENDDSGCEKSLEQVLDTDCHVAAGGARQQVVAHAALAPVLVDTRRGDASTGNKSGYYASRHNSFPLHELSETEDLTEVTERTICAFKGLEYLLQAPHPQPDDTLTLVRVLGKVCDCKVHPDSVERILQAVSSSQLLQHHLLLAAAEFPLLPEDRMISFLRDFLKLGFTICRKTPSNATKLLLSIGLLINNATVSGVILDTRQMEVQDGLSELQEECTAAIRMVRGPEAGRSVGRPREGSSTPREDHALPPQDFVSLPVFPQDKDMDCFTSPFLRANKVSGEFRDAGHYLDVHFRLLREDYIRPLRVGLQEYRKRKARSQEIGKISDIRIYHNVRVLHPQCGKTLEHTLQLDVTTRHRIKSSKRFMGGSLVCLSRDEFRTLYFATVSHGASDSSHDEGILQVCFENRMEEVMECGHGDTFVLVETCGAFFEAYRHVLEGLQEFGKEPERLPFRRYLVDVQQELKPPIYMAKTEAGTACMDLGPILKTKKVVTANDKAKETPPVLSKLLRRTKPEKDAKDCPVNILDPSCWPALEKTALNEPQVEAVRTALSKEIAIIQGPPGTGKTYVGLKVAEVLLKNCHVWTRSSTSEPLLVVCYTNHALDQFLEGILKFCPEGIVRIGSQSKNPNLDKFNLKSLRKTQKENREMKTAKTPYTKEMFDCQKELSNQKTAVQRLCTKLQAEKKKIHKENVLKPCMLDAHYEQLVNLCRVNSADQPLSVMTEWLSFGQLVNLAEGYVEEIEEKSINLKNISNLPYISRFKLYRVWVRRLRQDLFAKGVEDALTVGLSYGETQDSLDQTYQDILPDDQLKTFIDIMLFSAIVDCVSQKKRLKSKNKKQTVSPYCIKKWLGVKDLNEMIQHFEGTQQDQRVRAGVSPNVVQIDKLFHLLRTSQAMSPEKVARVTELWDPNFRMNDRVQLYLYWVQEYVKALKGLLKSKAFSYHEVSRRSEEFRLSEDTKILKKAKVIGLTTTGAARNRSLLTKVACPVVIIEEAAEVLEAHVVTSLHKDCQHLILIGDHQQLRPSPTVYELCRRYHLDLSLFERLINNGLPHATLAVQHRMRPEISRLVRHIYPHLQDHPCTQKRPHISGLQKDVFLFHHEELETQHGDTSSKSNRHEAELCVRLAEHLLLQGYPSTTITILAAYTGQVLLLKDLITNGQYRVALEGVFVTSVDNYQGEENDIIILSLVRSNEEGKVGFLSTDNRVCVALSRARNGFYAFGNFRILQRKSALWRNIVITAEKYDQFGKELVLRCVNHPMTETRVVTAKNFLERSPEGGCSVPCQKTLDCGHVCRLVCHSYDTDHKEYRCLYDCERQICKEKIHPCPCPRRCHQPCGDCVVLVEKILGCGHCQKVACYKSPDQVTCQTPCQTILPCGHPCPNRCHKTCEPCVMLVEKILGCGHLQNVACHKSPDQVTCQTPCQTILPCGHPCPNRCHKTCEPCVVLVEKILGCGHRQDVACHKSPDQVACQSPCQIILPCGHPCRKRCHETCGPCVVLVKKETPGCGHQQEVACHDVPARIACQAPCPIILPCGHACPKRCSLCGMFPRDHRTVKCPMMKVKKIWPCGHEVESSCYVQPGVLPCREPCPGQLDCGHPCSGSCGECWGGRVHVACRERCDQDHHDAQSLCSHDCAATCGLPCMPCRQPCPERCRHGPCPKPCGEPCEPCKKPCPWRCPHQAKCRELCHSPCQPCDQPCPKTLPCGHPCSGLCGEACLCIRCENSHFVQLKCKLQDRQLYIRYAGCRHIFNAADLDAFVRSQLKVLPLWRPVPCPVKDCMKGRLMDSSTWRYSRVLSERRRRQQLHKADLVKRTSPNKRVEKELVDSLIYYRSHLSRITKEHVQELDLTKIKQFKLTEVFTLTAISKLAFVLHTLPRHSNSRLDEVFSILKLQLQGPLRFFSLTEGQRRQLTTEVKRFFCQTLLEEAGESRLREMLVKNNPFLRSLTREFVEYVWAIQDATKASALNKNESNEVSGEHDEQAGIKQTDRKAVAGSMKTTLQDSLNVKGDENENRNERTEVTNRQTEPLKNLAATSELSDTSSSKQADKRVKPTNSTAGGRAKLQIPDTASSKSKSPPGSEIDANTISAFHLLLNTLKGARNAEQSSTGMETPADTSAVVSPSEQNLHTVKPIDGAAKAAGSSSAETTMTLTQALLKALGVLSQNKVDELFLKHKNTIKVLAGRIPGGVVALRVLDSQRQESLSGVVKNDFVPKAAER